MLTAANNGDTSVTLKELIKTFNAAFSGNDQYKFDDYGDWFTRIFGKNWLSDALNGKVDNGATAKNDRKTGLNGLKEEVGGAEQIEALKKVFPELSPILDKVQQGLDLSAEEVKKLADAFILEGVKAANEFNEALDQVANTLKGLAGTASEALSSMGDYINEMSKISKIRKATHDAEGKSGAELGEETLGVFSEYLGVPAEEVQKMDIQGISSLVGLLNQVADESYLEYGGTTIAEYFIKKIQESPTLFNDLLKTYGNGSGKLTFGLQDLMDLTSGENPKINDAFLRAMVYANASAGDFTFDVDYQKSRYGEAGSTEDRYAIALGNIGGSSVYTSKPLEEEVREYYERNKATSLTQPTSMFDVMNAFRSTSDYSSAMSTLQGNGMTFEGLKSLFGGDTLLSGFLESMATMGPNSAVNNNDLAAAIAANLSGTDYMSGKATSTFESVFGEDFLSQLKDGVFKAEDVENFERFQKAMSDPAINAMLTKLQSNLKGVSNLMSGLNKDTEFTAEEQKQLYRQLMTDWASAEMEGNNFKDTIVDIYSAFHGSDTEINDANAKMQEEMAHIKDLINVVDDVRGKSGAQIAKMKNGDAMLSTLSMFDGHSVEWLKDQNAKGIEEVVNAAIAKAQEQYQIYAEVTKLTLVEYLMETFKDKPEELLVWIEAHTRVDGTIDLSDIQDFCDEYKNKVLKILADNAGTIGEVNLDVSADENGKITASLVTDENKKGNQKTTTIYKSKKQLNKNDRD